MKDNEDGNITQGELKDNYEVHKVACLKEFNDNFKDLIGDGLPDEFKISHKLSLGMENYLMDQLKEHPSTRSICVSASAVL